jgi:hypothetical protein
MRIKRTRHFVLRDYQTRERLNDGADFKSNAERRENYVAFTCLLPHPDGKLYCGITAFNTDILHRFDPATGTFESLNYRQVAEPYEIKVHRSLELASNGTIYGASAGLIRCDERMVAPGGALFTVDPVTKQIEKLGIPAPHDYIQTITLDEARGLIYGQTYPCFRFFCYDLKTRQSRDFGYLGSITHLSAIDDDGGFWGTWDISGHWLFRYDPQNGKIAWHRHGLPNAKADSNIMYPGAGPIDCMLNGHDGYLYIGTCGGSLCRLDPRTAKIDYLGKPSPSIRLPGLIEGPDNLLLGCSGDEEGGNIFAYDRKTRALHPLGAIVDSESGLKLYRVHDMRLMGGNRLYVAETDVPNRSGYLWECEVEW